jgi:hypothetical protein
MGFYGKNEMICSFFTENILIIRADFNFPDDAYDG